MIPRSYEQIWNCCKVKKGYSGTAVFSKVKPLKVQFDLGIPIHDGEGRSITLEYEEFFLVAVYTPNAGDMLKRLAYRVDEWDRDMHAHLEKIKKSSNKPVIFGGDLNVAHHPIDVYDPSPLRE